MIVELTEEHARHVVANMAADDMAEILETHWLDDAEGFVEQSMCITGARYCLLAADGEPVVMGGLALFYPNVATAWMVGTPRLPECAVELTRTGRKLVKGALAGNIHRVHAFAAGFHTRAHPWLRAIGLKDETLLPRWGKTGADFIMFSAVR